MDRRQLAEHWVKAQFPGRPFSMQTASADASFRRYLRVFVEDQTFIVMDAPPQHENCGPFLNVAAILAEAGVHVPRILAHDAGQGFMLLSDLGSTTFLQALTDQPAMAQDLYGDAMDALIALQLSGHAKNLPPYDQALLSKELNLFPEWYIAQHLQKPLSDRQQTILDGVFGHILRNNLAQSKVLVHRDYHSRNLMMTSPNPGILDFQDAVYGPVTYDLVSLFKDAYIRWDEDRILDWVIRYWEKARKAGLPVAADFASFYRDFEWMGVQRHLKVLGIFARLHYRDGKSTYLNDMPVVMDYLRKACERYRELGPLLIVLNELNSAEPSQKIGYTF